MDSTIKQAITGFLNGHKPSTARSYRTPLGHFVTFLGENGLGAEEGASALTVDHAIGFVDWLRDRSPAKATLELYLTAVYRFYRFLLQRGADLSAADLARLEEVYRDARAIRGESRPKHPKLQAVVAVIEAARAAPRHPDDTARELARLRNLAIVETLRATGCRIGELVSIRMEDLDGDGQAQSALVKGKGSKYRTVYWDDLAWRALTAYHAARRTAGLATEFVFCGHGNRSKKQSLSTRHVDRIVRSLAKQAGHEYVTPHYFRHVFATQALGATDNLAVVQDLMGHASPTTTRVYAQTNEKQRKAAHARAWA